MLLEENIFNIEIRKTCIIQGFVTERPNYLIFFENLGISLI